jgi:cytochrome c oxidase assembly protein subunit 11
VITLDDPRKTAVKLAGVVLLMGVLVWVYAWAFRVTGYDSVGAVAGDGAQIVLDQTIRVRFDASKERDMPWEIKPVEREITTRIGETVQAYYEAYNPTDRPVAGRASFFLTPDAAEGFIDTIDCFCVTEQVLQPGERVQLPLTFLVDPKIVDSRIGKNVHTITLSYTFYEIDLPEGYAALETKAGDQLN